ncbi:unnamed protein product [Mytilus edulis]|uniref:Uncharacterized protein n=1 Tax=Mytilus edulis TaxID=6550 RepID=A0A8S3SRL7_MYTED|nr:unnamed protein product [Mytilus edulis]
MCHYQSLNFRYHQSFLQQVSHNSGTNQEGGKKAQPVVSMTLDNPTTPSSEKKRKPVFTEIPQVDLPGSSSSAILKLKEEDEIPLSHLLQENATTIDTRLGKVQTCPLLYFHLQDYEESQSVDVTACGNTKIPIQVTHIIDDLYKCCKEFIPISIE